MNKEKIVYSGFLKTHLSLRLTKHIDRARIMGIEAGNTDKVLVKNELQVIRTMEDLYNSQELYQHVESLVDGWFDKINSTQRYKTKYLPEIEIPINNEFEDYIDEVRFDGRYTITNKFRNDVDVHRKDTILYARDDFESGLLHGLLDRGIDLYGIAEEIME